MMLAIGLILTFIGVADTVYHWNRDRELSHIFLSICVKTIGFVLIVIHLINLTESL